LVYVHVSSRAVVCITRSQSIILFLSTSLPVVQFWAMCVRGSLSSAQNTLDYSRRDILS